MNKDQRLLEEAYQSIYESTREPAYFGPEKDKQNWLKWLKSLKHEVHEDGSVSVHQNVRLNDKNLTRIPFNFRSITGDFYCYNNNLTSLEGAPKEVGGDFYCYNNNLTSLEGAPEIIKGEFICDQFSDKEYRTFAKKRKYVDSKLDKDFDIDLEDF
jgi:hypothetical protein